MTKYAERQAEKERIFTAERLRAVLHYDENTGVFTWVAKGKGRRIGAVAGRMSGAGYRQLSVDGMYFYAQRLAWLYVTGSWPPNQVDHIDLDKTNNRFSNLRLAERVENQGNRPTNRNNGSGLKGVRFLHKTGMWQARITHNGKGYHLGNFTTSEEAVAAYARAAEGKFGKFARAV